jgi:flagella basal body P-ring formation protein FlgA
MRRSGAGLIFLLMLGAARTAFPAQGYALRVSATVNGPWILVGDLLSPRPEGDLAALKLRRLGPPGQSDVIPRDLVALKLRESESGAALFVSGSSCVVTASRRRVPGADIQAFADKYLRERLAALSATSEIEILPKQAPKDLLVPDRTVRLEIEPQPGARWRGNVVLRVLAHESGEDGADLEVGQSLLTCLVKVQQSLLVALRPIRSGDLISNLNAAVSQVDATFVQEDGYGSLDDAGGLKARDFIAADRVILPSMLERPPLIRRGDIVKLLVRSGMISVQTSARALRDAALGDSIPVEIVDSKKQLQAKVLDEGTVVSDSR